MSNALTVNDVLDGHVALDVECLDRLYLNGYVPSLQCGGQVVRFMKEHLALPVPSPAVFNRIGTAFRRAVNDYSAADDIPIVRFKKGDRRSDVMRSYLAAVTAPAVAAIGVVQEFQGCSAVTNGRPQTRPLCATASRRLSGGSAASTYVVDAEFGPAFIMICSDFPYPVKVWVNGHARHEAP